MVVKEVGKRPSDEYMTAENEAHDALVNAGFRPQGYDFELKKVVVLWCENKNTANEKRKFYYYDCWQEAFEALVVRGER